MSKNTQKPADFLKRYDSDVTGCLSKRFRDIKNSRAAKFIYNRDIEGRAFREIGSSLKNTARGIYCAVREAPHNLSDSEWRKQCWNKYKHTVLEVAVPLAFSIGVAWYTYATQTRYGDALDKISKMKLNNVGVVRDVWAQGKMPVQMLPQGNPDTIKLGHTSSNPFDYVSPSVNIQSPSVDSSSEILRFSTRSLTLTETSIINSFNSGAYNGLTNYEGMVAADVTYFTGLGIGKYEKKRAEQKK